MSDPPEQNIIRRELTIVANDTEVTLNPDFVNVDIEMQTPGGK